METVVKIILELVGIFLIPFLFMLIWNNIMPVVCGFGLLTYWQSFFMGIGLRLINGSVGTGIRLDKLKNDSGWL